MQDGGASVATVEWAGSRASPGENLRELKPRNAMERTRFIEYEGRQVVLLDYTGLVDEGDSLAEIEMSRRFFAGQVPDRSLLTLTDTTGARYTSPVIEALKRLAQHNKPFVKAAATVTGSRLHRVVIAAVAVFSGRKLPIFASRREALEWLVRQ